MWDRVGAESLIVRVKNGCRWASLEDNQCRWASMIGVLPTRLPGEGILCQADLAKGSSVIEHQGPWRKTVGLGRALAE